MQLETMQYFDETMSGAPDPAAATPFDVLKWALIDEKTLEYKSYDATLNQITFEERHGMTEHTIYTFSDKTSRIRSFIDIVDEKTVQVVRNIMHLQDFEITIESEKYSMENGRVLQVSTGFGVEFSSMIRFSTRNKSLGGIEIPKEYDHYRVLVSYDSLLALFVYKGFCYGFAISEERSGKYRVCINLSEYINSTILFISPGGIEATSISGAISNFEAPLYSPSGKNMNMNGDSDVFELMPTWCRRSKEVYPRILSAFSIGKQSVTEKIYYSDKSRIFSWKVESGEHLIIAVGGRDVTAFK